MDGLWLGLPEADIHNIIPRKASQYLEKSCQYILVYFVNLSAVDLECFVFSLLYFFD